MGMLNWFTPLNKALDIADQAITNKDKLNELKFHLAEVRENVYTSELKTKTVPWIDGLHKMGRMILSLLSLVIPSILIYLQPDIDPATIMAIVAPGGVYNYVKGKGQK